MLRVLPFVVIAAALSTAGCSAIETMPLADDAAVAGDTLAAGVPIPQPAPRAALASSATQVPAASVAVPPDQTETSKAVDEATPPKPVARPATVSGALWPSTMPTNAVAVLKTGLAQISEIAIGTANAAERERLDPSLFEASFGTDEPAPEAAPPAATIDDEAVERRDVKAVEGCVNDVFRSCPRTAPEAAPSSASLSPAATRAVAGLQANEFSVPILDIRTVLWVLIGFAAMLGLFFSVRRTAD